MSERTIPTAVENQNTEDADRWLESRAEVAALVITFMGFLARLWTASRTFLNPDEALHFRLANQTSLALAYEMGLTASHPPLLTVTLYYWRALGTSELWLRLPSVLAGALFCLMFYKWLSKAAGSLAGLIGLLFVAFLPPVVLLASEVRQYSLLIAFLVSALYFLDKAFSKNSSAKMAVFTLFLYLSMLSHYSAFLFAAALGIYALFRIFTEHPAASLIVTWAAGQLGAIALAFFLYKTHLAKLGAGDSRMVLQGWMSEYYLRRSYFDRAHDNPVTFLIGHSFGVFQYFFGQLAVGIAMGFLFVVAVALLLRGKNPALDPLSSRHLGLFLLLPFAIAGCASLAHLYPYGGTRHIAFLIIPGAAGVAVAMAGLVRGYWLRGLAITAAVIVLCIAFGKPRRPIMDRADQNRRNMVAAMEFIRQSDASGLIFTDYESDLILGHYLCQQQPITLETSIPDFEIFSCSGHRVVSASYKTATFTSNNFWNEWNRLVETYRLKPGRTVWVFQAGWDADLPEELGKQFHNLNFESFGRNIKIFKMTVGQPMPVSLVR